MLATETVKKSPSSISAAREAGRHPPTLEHHGGNYMLVPNNQKHGAVATAPTAFGRLVYWVAKIRQ
jgi:hypothetical protein